MTLRDIEKWTTICSVIGCVSTTCGFIYLGHWYFAAVTAVVSASVAVTIGYEVWR